MAEGKGILSALGDKIKDHAARERDTTSDDTGRTGKLGNSGSIGRPAPGTSVSSTAATSSGGSSGSFAKPTATTASSAKPTATTASSVKPTATAASSAKPTAAAASGVKPTAAAAAAQAGTAAAQAGKEGFTDIPPKAYYAKAVAWAVEKGITSGTTPTTFSPDNPCHRGHAATFLWRVKGSPAPGAKKNPFQDVSEGPFYQAILWATAQGYVPPESDNTFGTKEPCTRAQVLSFLARADGKANAEAKDGIIWAGTKGLLMGQPGGPGDACTRADIVYYLFKLYGKAK